MCRCTMHHTCTTWMLLTRDAEQAHLNISDGFYIEVYKELSENWTLCFSLIITSAKVLLEAAC